MAVFLSDKLTVRTMLVVMVAMQTLTVLLLAPSTIDKSERTMTSQHNVTSRNIDADGRLVHNIGSTEFPGCVIDDLLMAEARHELDDVAQIRRDGVLLSKAVVKAMWSKWNDVHEKRSDSRVNVNNTAANHEEVIAEADRRLELLGRVAELARYQLVNSVRRKRIEQAVESLRELVNQLKIDNRMRTGERQQSTKRLNIYEHKTDEQLPAWKQFHNGITQVSLYSADDGTLVVDQLVRDLKSSPIQTMYIMGREYGTQVHIMYRLKDRLKAFFKPQRVARNYERPSTVRVYYDVERHTAEIAAFHLDRILGFHRVPPCVGRKLSIDEEIKQFSDSENITGEFYESDGRTCFDGVCDITCDGTLPICADEQGYLEGSMAANIPLDLTSDVYNPYYTISTSYVKETERPFENRFPRDSDFCTTEVRKMAPFNTERGMLHLVDTHIFDFFTGNLDRHHIDIFDELGNDSFFPLYDNGKAFGTSERDEINLLAPLYQCCMVRLSTVDRLLQLYSGPDRLSDVMRRSLKADDLESVLTEAHLVSLDRRLYIILEEIHRCTQNAKDIDAVVIDDELS